MDFTTNLNEWIGRKFVIYPLIKWGDWSSGVWTVDFVTCSCLVYEADVQMCNPELHLLNGSVYTRRPVKFLDELKTPDRNDVLDEIKWRMSLSGVTQDQKDTWKSVSNLLSGDPSITVSAGDWIIPADWKQKKAIYQPWKK